MVGVVGRGALDLKNYVLSDPEAKTQKIASLDGFAKIWAKMSIAKGNTDYYSKNDKAYLQAAKDRGSDTHKYYGPYALNIEQLILAGYIEKNGHRYDWTGKLADGKEINTRADFLNLGADAHLEVFKEMMLGARDKFRHQESDDGLILFVLAGGNEGYFYKLLNEKDAEQGESSLIDNFQLGETDTSFKQVEEALRCSNLDRFITAYEFSQYSSVVDVDVPKIENIESLPDSKSQSFVERYSSKKSTNASAPLYEAIIDHMWNGKQPKDSIYIDDNGNRRYSALGFSTNDLKLLQMLEKDKASGAYVWSEKAGVHTELCISYDEYRKNWRSYIDAARTAFVDKVKSQYENISRDYFQVLWNNVVQGNGLDQYLGAEGYVVNGKTYTMDGISIVALSRFHSAKDTKIFLKSIDRKNPVLTPGMAETLERFHGRQYELDLDIHPMRTFKGEGGKTFRYLDYRKQYAVQDMGENDYLVTLETKAFRESSYDLTAGNKYMGYYQINKNYLLNNNGYLDKYNKAHGTKYTESEFNKNQLLQTAIIRDYHKDGARYNAASGLIDYTPYVMNKNIVEFEYLSPPHEVQKNSILSPEKFKKAKLLKVGTGKTEFGFQVGATYSYAGRGVKVTDVGTRSEQINPLMSLSMSHLGGDWKC